MAAVGVGVGPSHRIASQRRAGGGGAAFDADAVTLIAAMTVEPDAARQTLINDRIVALKDAGIWAKVDELWFPAAHDQQAALLGWKRYKNLTAVNAPTFTVDRGFAGDGMTSYLNTNFVPSTDGVQYTLNDTSFGVYNRTAATGGVDIGSLITNRGYLAVKLDAFSRVHVNQTNSTDLRFAVTESGSLGLNVARRTTSNAIQQYINGDEAASNAVASTGMPAASFFIGALNNNGTPILFTTRQYAFAFAGAALTAGEQLSLYNVIQDYLTDIGAEV